MCRNAGSARVGSNHCLPKRRQARITIGCVGRGASGDRYNGTECSYGNWSPSLMSRPPLPSSYSAGEGSVVPAIDSAGRVAGRECSASFGRVSSGPLNTEGSFISFHAWSQVGHPREVPASEHQLLPTGRIPWPAASATTGGEALASSGGVASAVRSVVGPGVAEPGPEVSGEVSAPRSVGGLEVRLFV